MISRAFCLVMLIVPLHILCQAINRFPTELYEDDPCPLKNGNKGICRQTKNCRHIDRSHELHCEFSGNQPVICCPLLPNVTFDASARIVENACKTVRSTSVKVIDHVVGNAVAANVGEFPFMALIMYNETRTRCGAALIADRFLLTAAHCFKFASIQPKAVRLGTNQADDPLSDMYPIVGVIRHNKYNRVLKENDIALLELGENVKRNANVQPICLHTDLIDLPENTNLTIMGWGQDNTENFPNSLLKAVVHPVLRSTCQTNYQDAGHTLKLSENQICALGETNKQGIATDGCEGDSGGPLVLRQNNKYYLAGLVSVGTGCGNVRVPGVYTRVANYLDWITERVWKN